MARLLGALLLLGSVPFRWLTWFSDAVDEPWDVHDPFLSADSSGDESFA